MDYWLEITSIFMAVGLIQRQIQLHFQWNIIHVDFYIKTCNDICALIIMIDYYWIVLGVIKTTFPVNKGLAPRDID